MQTVSGIYKIINKVNGKYYVGSSSNICGDVKGTRWKRHIWSLAKNIHHNIYLQREWNKYGKDNFDWVIVKEIPKEILLVEEQKYLDVAKIEKEKCYNLTYVAGGGDWADVVKKKFSKKRMGKGNPMYGKHLSKNHKEKIRIALKGKAKSLEHRNHLSIIGMGHEVTKETRQKISKAHYGKYKGSKNPSYNQSVYKFFHIDTHQIFVGTSFDFYTKYNIRQSDACALIHGRQKTCKRWAIV